MWWGRGLEGAVCLEAALGLDGRSLGTTQGVRIEASSTRVKEGRAIWNIKLQTIYYAVSASKNRSQTKTYLNEISKPCISWTKTCLAAWEEAGELQTPQAHSKYRALLGGAHLRDSICAPFTAD